MFFTEERLEMNVRKLKELRFPVRESIEQFECTQAQEEEVGKRPEQVEYTGIFHKGDFWTGRGTYMWIGTEVQLPEIKKGQKVVGIFNMGKTGGGLNSGFEGFLYLGGSPYCEIGSYHEEFLFSEELAGKKVRLDIRLWAGLEGGGIPTLQTHRFQKADICVMDCNADDFYYTSKAAIETIQRLGAENPVKEGLLIALDRAHSEIDWRQPGSPQFYQSLETANVRWKEEVRGISWTSPVTVHTIGHSHIDVAWLWQLKHTREKAARTFSTMCTLMEQYPEFIFIQSQPQLYQYIKKDYPDIFQRIKEKVKAGNWEPNGAMWVEADCNISSGEALVRQILTGQRFFQKEFGVTSSVLWLPDVFGYSWALPQVLRKSGIKNFMTIKISWNQYNEMPHDTFKWVGIDGSEVLTHFMTTPADEGDSGGYTYNGTIEPASVLGAWKLYHDKKLNQNLLLAYGYGDGGGGVNREMLEMGRHLKEMPGVPKVVPGSVKEYFEGLQKQIANTDQRVPVWDGELYLEYHRGTYTSQARNKRFNRKTELELREIEWLWSMVSLKQKDFGIYPSQAFEKCWETVLRNQFHDIIPGSSIHEVYEDSRKEYRECNEVLDEFKKKALSLFAGEEKGLNYTVVNNSSFSRQDIVEIPVSEGKEDTGGQWCTADGRQLESVYVDGSWKVKMSEMAPLSMAGIHFVPDENVRAGISRKEFSGEMDTPFYHVLWNEKGQILSLYDKENDRQVLETGKKGNCLMVYEDRPLRFDAWDVDIYYKEKAYEVENLQKAYVEETELSTNVYLCWKYQDSQINQEIIFYHHNRRIDFQTKVDWQEHQQLLRVLFPVDIRTSAATFDIQYGNVQRPTHENTSWDMAKFETVGHQWADLSETGYGVSLLNDCKYGYSAKKNVLGLSLIKSGIYPDYAADQGIHEFTYALYPHKGSWQEAGVQKQAWELNNPLWCQAGKVASALSESFCKADCENVAIDCVKKAEDGDFVVVRFHEYMGMRGKVTLLPSFDVENWEETDLMENPVGEERSGSVCMSVKPYEIKTVRMKVGFAK